MQVELDVEAVRRFVTFRHPILPPRRDVPPRADPFVVARLATQLVIKVLGGISDGDQCRVAECAGLLVYAMDGYGLNYEEVCGIGCHKVAEVLRQITPDHRQTDPLRHMALRSMIGQADAPTQAVKLAEITATIARLSREYDGGQLAARALDLKNWVDRTGHILEAMKALRDLPRLHGSFECARKDLAQAGRRADAAREEVRGQLREARAMRAAQENVPAGRTRVAGPGQLGPVAARA